MSHETRPPLRSRQRGGAGPGAAGVRAGRLGAGRGEGSGTEPKPSMTIYGFAMLDIGQNFKQINPNWYDTMRVTKLPSYADQFGKDNSTFAGVRQTRFGVKTSDADRARRAEDQFEFELFGTGVDAGQTTFRLRHALRRTGRVRRRPDVEPVHGPGRVPELARVLGPDGHGVLPQRAGALDADQGRRRT